MTVPINMTLYRLLVKTGATEAEAQEAATMDASALATRADLAEFRTATRADLAELRAGVKTDIAELKAELFKHTTQTLLAATGIFGIIVSIVAAITRLFT